MLRTVNFEKRVTPWGWFLSDPFAWTYPGRGMCCVEGGAAAGAGEGKGGAGAEGSGEGEGEGEGGGDNGSGSNDAKSQARIAELETQLGETQKKLNETTAESIKRKKQLAQYEGMTPDEIAELRKEKDERDRKDREARGAYEEQLNSEREKTRKEREQREQAVERYQQSIIEREILSAAGGLGALEQSLQKLPGGGQAQIVAVTQGLFEYDDEKGEVFHKTLRKEDGTRFSVIDFFTQERTGALANHFGSKVLNGPGADGAEGAGGAEVVKISRTDPDRLKKVEKAKTDKKKVAYTD